MPTVLVKASSPLEEDRIFEIVEGETIFEGLERLGLVLPHGCLAGSCGACRIEVVEGAENLKQAGAVESDTVAHLKNQLARKDVCIRLSCRAKVIGNIEIKKL
jgi:ferredoxin